MPARKPLQLFDKSTDKKSTAHNSEQIRKKNLVRTGAKVLVQTFKVFFAISNSIYRILLKEELDNVEYGSLFRWRARICLPRNP
jgi:hypothetical protein